MASKMINLQYCSETQLKSIEGLDASKAKRLMKIRKEVGELTLQNLVDESKIDESHWQSLIEENKITLENVVTKRLMKEHVEEHVQRSLSNFETRIKREITESVNENVDLKFDEFKKENFKFIETTVGTFSTKLTARLDIIVADIQDIKRENQSHEQRFIDIEEKIADVSKAYDSANNILLEKIENNSKEIADLTTKVNTGFLLVNNRIDDIENKMKQSKSDYLRDKLKTEQASVQEDGTKTEVSATHEQQLLQQKKLIEVANNFESAGLPSTQPKSNQTDQGAISKKFSNKEDTKIAEIPKDNLVLKKNQATSTPISKTKEFTDSTYYPMPELSTIVEKQGETRRNESSDEKNTHVKMNLYSDKQETEHSVERQSRSREKKGKIYTGIRQRSNSSSSDSSGDKSYLWTEDSENERPRQSRSKSPQTPKMSTFTGSGTPTWESFIFQFERTAGRRRWNKKTKINRLLDCLRDDALEYARKAYQQHYGDYDTLRKEMKGRFSKKEAPMSARRQLYYTRQQEGETIEEFAQRAYFITMDGYDKYDTRVLEAIAIETFLRGCRDKDSASKAMERNPRTLNKAVKLVKTSIANQRALFGSTRNNSHAYYQRQVTFADTESPRSTSPMNSQTNNSSLEQEVRNLTGVLNRWVTNSEEGNKNQYNTRYSPTRNHYYSGPASRNPNYQPYDRHTEITSANMQNDYQRRDTRSPNNYQRRRYDNEHRSPTNIERQGREYNRFRSPSPIINSRAQYLYSENRNTERWRSNSPREDIKRDQQSPNRYMGNKEYYKPNSPEIKKKIYDQSINKEDLNKKGSSR